MYSFYFMGSLLVSGSYLIDPFWYLLFVLFCFISVLFVMFLLCSRWSFVDVPLIFPCPADHVPDWEPRTLLGMVEARSVNVENPHTDPPLGGSMRVP